MATSGGPRSLHLAVFTSGGVGWALTNVSVYLAAGLAKDGHEVDFISLYSNDAELRDHYADVDGFADVVIRPLRVAHARTSLPALIRYLRRHRPDALFSQLTYINATAVLARLLSGTRCKNILLEGTVLSRTLRANTRVKLARPLISLTYPLAEIVVGKSPAAVEDLKRFFGGRIAPDKLRFLPNPYPLDRFRRLSLEDAEMPWHDKLDLPVVTSVGRLASEKAYDVLIESFATARQEVPSRLLIIGEGPERVALESQAERLGISRHVAFPGWSGNPWKYLARSSVFVLPSRWEGWPSSLVEAMALGMPVITTDCEGGGREMVQDAESGFIVPVNDASTLSERLVSVLSNPELGAQLGDAARRSSESYCYLAVARRYADLARDLLRDSAKP